MGEVVGLLIGTALGLGNVPTIALAIGLAFLFGYSLSTLPLLRSGIAFRTAFVAAYPVNRFLLARGKGHVLTHQFHEGHQGHSDHANH